MRWGYVATAVGAVTLCVGLAMLAAVPFSLAYGAADLWPLLVASAITAAFGGGLLLVCRGYPERAVSHREGMAVTTLGWLSACLFGALPFILAGTFPTIHDCFFESFSGFTTTGASVLTDIEAVPKGLLFWRSLTHWLGGMGIIVLSLAILPFLGVGGMQLYRAEVPGPVPDKLTPRIKDTAAALWKVYILFSAAQTVLLMFGGMNLFDALCHTFGTMATGGFSTRNASLAAFDSAYIQWVVVVFMLLAGINFSLHYNLLLRRFRPVWRDPELRIFLGLFLAVWLVVWVAVRCGTDLTGEAALRHAAFQVSSILTTTGFASYDYEIWPYVAQALLVGCMFVGGSAGSTGGGMKVMRLALIMRSAYTELLRIIHPRGVYQVKFGGRVVAPEVVSGIWGFVCIWLVGFVLGGLALTACNVDIVTSFSASVAALGNIGPGLGLVGPTDNYAFLPAAAKWTLILLMLLGRLEIFTVVILLVPEFWRK